MNPLAGVLLVATATVTSAALEAASDVRVRPIAFLRGLPHAFHDQTIETLEATEPRSEIVERVRAASIGGLSYALVASKPGPQAERVEVRAVAVNGRHAWSIDGSAVASGYPALRAAVMSAIRGRSGTYVPARAELAVRGADGRPIPLTAAAMSDLLWDLEVLIASCSIRLPAPAPPAPARVTLDLGVRYAEPRDLGLDLLEGNRIAIEEIHIFLEPERERGWPAQSIRYRGGEMGLGKCDGGGILRLLCRDELRGAAPKSITASCHLLEK